MKKLTTHIEKNIGLWALIALTLGLAPFTPEPHIWGKLKWIAGGAEGMKGKDWFDTFLHGIPWLIFLLSILLRLRTKFSTRKNESK
ncbi:MAG: hypothetical protein WDZ35_06840 [Crocinitomicaceae bacterium]